MLTVRPTPPFGETVWLDWRMSATNWLYVITVSAIIIFVAWAIYYRWDETSYVNNMNDLQALLFSVALFGSLTWFIIHLDRGYRVAYDEEAIYTRAHGMQWNFKRYPWIRLPFEEIALVRGEWQREPPVRVMPFQYARVYRKDWDGKELFPLVGGELYDDQFKYLLSLINEKAPGTLSEEIAFYMNNHYRF